MITSAARQENKETSKFMRWRLWENSMMESIQSPKLRTHCSLWRTTPLQKISLSFSGSDLSIFKTSKWWSAKSNSTFCTTFINVSNTWRSLYITTIMKTDLNEENLFNMVNDGTYLFFYFNYIFFIKESQPVGKSEYEEFNKGRFKQQILVLWAEVWESWYVFSPSSDYIHGTSEQVVKLLDVTRIFLFLMVLHSLLVLLGNRTELFYTPKYFSIFVCEWLVFRFTWE